MAWRRKSSVIHISDKVPDGLGSFRAAMSGRYGAPILGIDATADREHIDDIATTSTSGNCSTGPMGTARGGRCNYTLKHIRG